MKKRIGLELVQVHKLNKNPIQQAVYAAPIIPIYYQGEYTAWIGPGSSTTQSPLATLRNSGFQKNQRHEFDGTMKS
ncbi:hypothetical protein [Bacteroides xylanisolvens]|uniref:hypothetical protein n=1 Tax=Bacteroides xylanisolvens TaxID=371601 RepID=UPI00216688EB|nr:hypothetical protein [Bacteroides xylanisolvens]MCS2626519.1 hypothetical protein [Bacteroides xylanisolvens]